MVSIPWQLGGGGGGGHQLLLTMSYQIALLKRMAVERRIKLKIFLAEMFSMNFYYSQYRYLTFR